MAKEIRFTLSEETDEEFKIALEKWATAKAEGLTIRDIRRQETEEGGLKIPEAVIVLQV